MLVERRVYILVRDRERVWNDGEFPSFQKEERQKKSGRRWDAVAAAPDAGSLVSVS